MIFATTRILKLGQFGLGSFWTDVHNMRIVGLDGADRLIC